MLLSESGILSVNHKMVVVVRLEGKHQVGNLLVTALKGMFMPALSADF